MKRLLAIAALAGAVAVPTVATAPADAAMTGARDNALCVWQDPVAGVCVPDLDPIIALLAGLTSGSAARAFTL